MTDNDSFAIKPNQTKLYIYFIYMNKEELELNNQQWFICHKTKPKQIPRLREKSRLDWVLLA